MGKLAFRGGAEVAGVVLPRLGVGAIILWAVAAALRTRIEIPARRWPQLLSMGILSAAVGLLLFGAVERIPASTTTLLLYAHPAMVSVIVVLLGRERMSASKLVALALGLGGVALVVGAPVEGLDPVGAGLALGAALMLALYVVVAQTGSAGISPLIAGAIALTVATALYLPIALAGGGLASTGSSWWWVLGVGAATGSGVALFLAALSRLGPIRATIGATVEPVTAVVLGAVLLAERLAAIQLLGGLLVVTAVTMLPFTRRAAEPPEAERAPSSLPRR